MSKWNRGVLRSGLGFWVISLGVSFSLNVFARDFQIDLGHSNVGFVARHMVSKVNGEFKDFDGSFNFDPKKPETAKVSANVKVASINTNQPKRDEHLKADDFFAEKKFPMMTFVSTKVTPEGEKNFRMEGDLTIRGITKPVVFDVEYLGEADDPWGGHRAGFTASTSINRKDFGINFNKTLDNGGVLVGDTVQINLNVEGLEKKAGAESAAPKKSKSAAK